MSTLLAHIRSLSHRAALPAESGDSTSNAYNHATLRDGVIAALADARCETLAAGVDVFYQDKTGQDLMEKPDGRKFKIRYLSEPTAKQQYEILGELK